MATAIASAESPNGTTVTLPSIKRRFVEITVRGTTSLITNRYSEDQLDQTERAQQGAAKTKKPPRNPQREFEGALYKLPDGRHGFPAIAFKLAMVRAGQRFADEKATELLGAFSIVADLLAIETPNPPTMRTDRVVLSGPSRPTSLAYRPEFTDWHVVLPIIFNSDFISLDQIVNLVSIAGFSVGVGCWRPEKKGTHGMFEAAEVREVHLT